jgi:hypothetical protein
MFERTLYLRGSRIFSSAPFVSKNIQQNNLFTSMQKKIELLRTKPIDILNLFPNKCIKIRENDIDKFKKYLKQMTCEGLEQVIFPNKYRVEKYTSSHSINARFVDICINACIKITENDYIVYAHGYVNKLKCVIELLIPKGTIITRNLIATGSINYNGFITGIVTSPIIIPPSKEYEYRYSHYMTANKAYVIKIKIDNDLKIKHCESQFSENFIYSAEKIVKATINYNVFSINNSGICFYPTEKASENAYV